MGSMAQIGLIFELFVSARGWLNLPTVTVQLCHGKVTKPILAPKTTRTGYLLGKLIFADGHTMSNAPDLF